METKQAQAWSLIIEEISRIAKEKGRGGGTFVANRLGVSRGTISRWKAGVLQGKRVPYDKTVSIMRILGLDPTPFFGVQPVSHAYIQVPWLEAEASMGGGGSTVVSKKIISHLSFRADWILAKGNPKKMAVINAGGRSMEPTIPDDSIVLINEGQTSPVNGKIYFVCYGSGESPGIYLKRLRVDQSGNVTHLVSDLDGYEMPIDPDENFEIIGQAIWFAKEL